MTHRIKPGDRYKMEPTGPTYENTLPHDIFVDRTPIFVGGTIGVERVFAKPTIEVVFDTGGRFPGLFSDAARKRMDDALDAAILGKSVIRPSPKKESPFPAFDAPERPAEPEAPKPTPDTPAVATLKALLADRQKVVVQAENAVKETAAFIERLEWKVGRAQKDLDHEQAVLDAAAAEVDAVISDIVKLGGTVEAQP